MAFPTNFLGIPQFPHAKSVPSGRLNRQIHYRSHKALKRSLNGRSKTNHKSFLLGFTNKELLDRLETFPNWTKLKQENWELDHIFPVKAFVEHKIYDTKIINSLDNLQPLTREENLKKGAKYNKKEFDKWVKTKLTKP